MQGTPPVPTYNIHSLLHTSAKSLLTTCQLLVVNICMTNRDGHLQVLGIGGVNHQVESEKIFSPEKVMVLGDKVLVNLAICSSISFSTIF